MSDEALPYRPDGSRRPEWRDDGTIRNADLLVTEGNTRHGMSTRATHDSLINRVVTAVSYDGNTGAIRSITFGGVGTIEFPNVRPASLPSPE